MEAVASGHRLFRAAVLLGAAAAPAARRRGERLCCGGRLLQCCLLREVIHVPPDATAAGVEQQVEAYAGVVDAVLLDTALAAGAVSGGAGKTSAGCEGKRRLEDESVTLIS